MERGKFVKKQIKSIDEITSGIEKENQISTKTLSRSEIAAFLLGDFEEQFYLLAVQAYCRRVG